MSTPRVDPRTGAIFWPAPRPGVPMGPVPLRSRPRLFNARRGLGDIPNYSGAAGPLIADYSEGESFYSRGGGGGGGSVQDSLNPPALTGGQMDPTSNISVSTAPTKDPSVTGYLPASSPYGESDRKWTNPTTFSSVPIAASTSISIPVLSQNYQRNALIIQNGSTATSPDTTPIMYVGFNSQPIIGVSLFLSAGQGIFFDIICPRDSIYIAFGPFSNAGGTAVVQGSVVQGTYAP